MDKNKGIKVVLIFSLIGIILSGYMVYDHYSSKSSVCDINAVVSCALVNSSVFSAFLNVPVAVLGFVWFLFLGLFSFRMNEKSCTKLFFLWNVLGLVFAFYLIGAEIWLGAICPTCTILHVIIAINFVMAFLLYKGQEIKPSWKSMMKSQKHWIIAIAVVYAIIFLLFNLIPIG